MFVALCHDKKNHDLQSRAVCHGKIRAKMEKVETQNTEMRWDQCNEKVYVDNQL